ncbi:hypothetical protein C7974DRAFT_411346 [Boeremia exigua]|uniref:uncharacterized protein n=1 Tax=Boeremia exigua TaxID=749465 RepID=UPI001E8EF16E|nr:uncharacterized protein C7974DRAFT_411346 [Boeremia exigua]KAH6637890.1 hypothetical protein C7974DRAFT_411346 [Boeremia exigua]
MPRHANTETKQIGRAVGLAKPLANAAKVTKPAKVTKVTNSAITKILCDQKTQRNQQQSPLLRLPAELRNNIYAELVPNNKVIEIGLCTHISDSLMSTISLPDWAYLESQLALQHVCRQMHNEIGHMFYTQSVFCANDPAMLRHWASRLSHEHRGLVRHLQVCHDFRLPEPILNTLPNLRTLTLEGLVLRLRKFFEKSDRSDRKHIYRDLPPVVIVVYEQLYRVGGALKFREVRFTWENPWKPRV